MSAPGRHPLSPTWQTFWTVIGVPLVLVQLLGLTLLLNPYSKQLGDLSQDWLSARCYYEGLPVYSSMNETVPQFLGVSNETRGDKLLVNAHPPTSILLALPFGQLSYPLAKLTWNLLSLLAVATSIYAICCRYGLNLDRSNIWPLTAIVLCSGPLAAQVATAQFNAFLLLMLTGAWLAQRNGWSLAAGAVVGLAASFKLFPLFMLFVFLCERDWKAVLSGTITFLIMLALAVSVFGTEAFHIYVTEVMPEVANWRGAWLNSSFTGFWSRVFDPGNPSVIAWYESPRLAKIAIGISALLVAALVARRAWQSSDTRSRDIAYSVGVVGMLLLSPTTWDHYWLMLLLPIAVLWWQAAWPPYASILLWTCIVVLAFVRPTWVWLALLGFDPRPGIANVASPLQSLLVLAIPTYVLVLLFGLAITRRATDAQAVFDASPS